MDERQRNDEARRGERPDLDAVGRLLSLTGQEKAPLPDGETLRRLEESVRPHWQEAVAEGRGRRRRRLLALSAAAASLLLVVGMVALYLRSGGARVIFTTAAIRIDGEEVKGPGVLLTAGREVHTGDAKATLELSDGTDLRLDRDTRLRLLDQGAALTSGAVYVDTEGRSGNRIRIVTPFGTARDIGTRFEVRVLGDDMRVRVRNGVVELGRESLRWTVSEGEEARLGAPGGIRRRTLSPEEDPWAWATGLAVAGSFDGRTLGDFLGWVEDETGARVEFAEASLGARSLEATVHGDVEGMPLPRALEVVLAVAGLERRWEGDRLVLEARVGEEAGGSR